MGEERERVQREHDAELERQKRRERERCEAAERLARERAEAVRIREQELAERARLDREEQARLLAMREAEVERARIEAEARMARELKQREHAHRVELERQRALTRANGRRFSLVTSGVLALGSAIGAAAIHFGYHRGELSTIDATHTRELSSERERLVAAEQRLASMTRRLEGALGELEQRRTADVLPPPSSAPRIPRPNTGALRGPAPTGKIEKKACRGGDPNDPLNPCLNP
jgi:colicin import membrane protein